MQKSDLQKTLNIKAIEIYYYNDDLIPTIWLKRCNVFQVRRWLWGYP